MAEKHNVKEIEAGIKQLLKMGGSAGGVDNRDGRDQMPAAIGPAQPHNKAASTTKEGVSSPGRSKRPKKKKNINTEGPNIAHEKKKNSNTERTNSASKKKKGHNTESLPTTSAREKSSKVEVSKPKQVDGPVADSSEEETVVGSSGLNSPSVVRYLDNKLTSAVMKELEIEHIFPLKKKSQKFPTAKYFCRLCSYHCDTVSVCRQHFCDARHRRKKEIQVQDAKLRGLPSPSEHQLTALDNLVDEIYLKYGLSDAELATRRAVATEVEEYLQKHIPGLGLNLYGSSLNGLGLKCSDVNMDMVLGQGQTLALTLVQVYRTLQTSDLYPDVTTDFQSKVPSVLFKSQDGMLDCQITIGCEAAYHTSRYLAMYTRLDPRVRKLAVIFRYWAKVCQVDTQDHGSLPAYTFGLMTVYFLQQSKPPILPVFWKVLTEEVLRRPKTTADVLSALAGFEKERWTSRSDRSVGSLWRDLLMFYGVEFDLAEYIICVRAPRPLSRAEKKWKSKRVCIEDPFSQKRNVARSMSNTRIFDYFFNCLRKGCLYFSRPSNHSSLKTNKRRPTCQRKSDHLLSKADEPKTKPPDSDASEQVPIECSKNAADGGCTPVKPVVPNAGEQDVHSNGDSSSDPCIPDHELLQASKSDDQHINPARDDGHCGLGTGDGVIVAGDAVSDDIVEGSKVDLAPHSCETDRTPQTSHQTEEETVYVQTENCDNGCSEDILSDLIDKSSGGLDSEACGRLSSDMHVVTTTASHDIHGMDTREADQVTHNENRTLPEKNTNVKIDSEDIVTSKLKVDTVNLESKPVDSDIDMNSQGGTSGSQSFQETPDSSPLMKRKKRTSSPADAEYVYELTSHTLTDGKGPSIFCEICEKEGHLKANCPDDQLPALTELPPVTKHHITLLTTVIKQVPKDFKLSKRELDQRDAIVRDLERHIQDTFPDAQLCLFGSSKNGFGFHHSDLDICVTFKNRDQKDVNFVEYIEVICKRLKTHRGLYNVFPIASAKVPIVKFRHRDSNLEGDISLFNILAQENTRMLSLYARIDHRVTTLGYAIKVFAKVCDIGDASRGSLSSYAYMLMMVHYLQHTSPPVIPVLQELGEHDPDKMIDGWNVSFFDDFSRLNEVWPGYNMNMESVGSLWLGFFRYYLEVFSFEEQVISIRQFTPLTKFEKLWNGKCTAIEDPFDTNHNLGGGLSRKMNQYILRTFIHARELYGRCVESVPDGYQSVQDYFFDKEQLTEGEPPSDRLCRACNKIGHIAKECPVVAARKEREAKEKKRREEMRQAQAEQNSPTAPVSRRRGNSPTAPVSRRRGDCKPDFKKQNRPAPARSLSDQGGSSNSMFRGQQQYPRNQSYPNMQSFDQQRHTQWQGQNPGSGLLQSPDQQKFPQGFSFFNSQGNNSPRNAMFPGNPSSSFQPTSHHQMAGMSSPQQETVFRFGQPNQVPFQKKNGSARFPANQGGY